MNSSGALRSARTGKRMQATREAICVPERLEQHRAELTRFCQRMLGASEAEDSVQETFIRAWRSFEGYEGRAPLRSWLYRIATNVCLDMLQERKRRARPIDVGSVGDPQVAGRRGRLTPLQPMLDGRATADGSPEDAVLARESVSLALVAMIRHLPPRQRAVLILREVLRWQASEVAELLETSVASVNSALQRARATLRMSETSASDASRIDGTGSAELLTRYVDAFERYDMDALMSVLREDATSAGSRERPRGWQRSASRPVELEPLDAPCKLTVVNDGFEPGSSVLVRYRSV
jgi:RNA polymerase sigma-70 factor, ECF subfamily